MSTYSSLILTESSLVSFWRLKEISGTSAADSKGSNTGTYTSGYTLAKNPIPNDLDGQSVSLNGSTGYINVGTPATTPPLSTSYTLEAWVNIPSSVNISSGNFGLISYGTNNVDQVNALVIENNGLSNWWWLGAGDATYSVPYPINDGKWHHIVACWDGTTRYMYYDGFLIGSQAKTGLSATSNNMTLGLMTTAFFNGLLTNCAIYNSCLSASTILNHYLIGYPTNYNKAILNDSPVAFWPLFDTTTTALDLINSNNGTYNGGYTQSQSALSNQTNGTLFNGSTGYVDCGNVFNYNRTFSIEAWVKTTGSGTGAIFSHGYQSYYLRIRSDGKLDFLQSQITDIFASTITINDGKWHHVVLTVDGSGNLSMYIDGVLNNTSTTSATFSATYHITIGRESNISGSATEFLTGTVANAALYNYILSANQILAHYLSAFIPSDYDNAVLAESSLVSYWPLRELSGTTANDLRSSNNGTYTNSPILNQTAPNNRVDAAITLNGSNQYVSVSDNSSLHLTSNFTLEAWVKTSFSSSFQELIAKYASSPFPGYGLGINNSPAGKLAIFTGDNTSSWFNSNTSISDGNWHHVVGVLNGTTVSLYIDGVLDSIGTRTVSLSNTNGLKIGTDPNSAGSNSFNGNISSVAIYNTALTLSQIHDHYLRGSTAKSYIDTIMSESSLVSYWPLDDVNTTAYDHKGGNNGSYNNTTILQDQYGASLLGPSTLFNGSSSYVEAPTATNLHPTTTLSLEAWVNLTSLPSAYRAIVDVGFTSQTAPFTDYNLYINPSNQLQSGLTTSGTQKNAINTVAATTNTWYHIVSTYDGSNLKLYINGSLVATTAVTGSIANSGQPFSIGRYHRGSSTGEYFPGYIQHVALYNAALTSTQVSNHYNNSAYAINARISQLGLLVINQGNPKARVSQVGFLVVTPKITSAGSSVILVGMDGLKKLSEFTGGMG